MAVRAVKDAQGRVRTGRVGVQSVGSGSGSSSPVLFTYDFIASPSLPATLSLSRATTGMYFNSSGVHSIAAINAARFENTYNGTSWVGAGLLVEEQRTNYISVSNAFAGMANNSWTGTGADFTITGATQPDGNSGVAQIINATSTAHGNYQTGLPSSTGTFSLHAKEYSGSLIKIYLGLTAGHSNHVNFDVATGAVTKVVAGVGTASVNLASGWWRLVAIGATGTDVNQPLFWFRNTANPAWDATYGDDGGFSGDSTSGLNIYGAQVELGPFATSYIPTPSSGSSVTRSADLVSATGTLATQLAAGPSVWEMQDQATGAISRTSFAAGAFTFPTSKLYRSFGVYPSGTDTSPYLTVGGAY